MTQTPNLGGVEHHDAVSPYATPVTRPEPLTVEEIEILAKQKLPPHIYGFYASGSDAEIVLRRNRSAFDRLYIRPRVLVNVGNVDTSTRVFGWKTTLPIGIAPSAMQRLAGGDGELDTAKAAVKMGLNMTLSSQSTISLEDVIGVRKERRPNGLSTTPPFWMQLYLYEDMEKSIPLIQRAEAAGYEALVLTVDTPVLGNRLFERRVPITLPPGMSLPNIENSGGAASVTMPSVNRQLINARSASEARDILAAARGSTHSSSLTWASTIRFLRRVSRMKIILKGIMTSEDSELAVKYGVDGIIVSNHGGRQLDSASSTIEALAEVTAAVRERIPVVMDGGVRTGSDVFKALALGANFVLVGRPVLWGLSYNGQKGVETVMHILERELSRTMALAGAANVESIKRSMLGIASHDAFGVARL